jgi:multidrug efflux pump subunit AcrA (membrane-fusion protein)
LGAWLMQDRVTRCLPSLKSSRCGFISTFPQSLAPGINISDEAELRLNEMPDKVFPGKVVRTSGAIDPNSRTLPTEVDVPNEDGKLLPGAYVQVHLMSGASGQKLLVPENSLLFRSEGASVGVVGSHNRVQIKKIKIGRDLGTRLGIVQGLSPGTMSLLALPIAWHPASS